MSKKITRSILTFSILLLIFSIWIMKKFPVTEKPKAYLTENKSHININGKFELQDLEGNLTNEKDFKDKYMMIYFGFSFCPDICPMTLGMIKELMHRLPTKISSQIVVIFVTIDPERDKPALLKDYMKQFGEKIIALTGTEEQINKAKSNYRIYSQKIENPDHPENYLMDHSSLIYLMDKNAKYLTHYNLNSKLIDIENSLIKHIKSSEEKR